MRLGIVGASGRMGRALIAAVTAHEACTVGAAIDAPGSTALGQDAGTIAGCGTLGVPVLADPLDAMLELDGVIDFSTPASTCAVAELAAQARIVHVIGTTGFDAAEERAIAAAARHATVVKAGNMSLGVNLLTVLSERAAAALPDGFDIEIVEMHHRHKVDAPSGTALMLGEAAARGRNIDLNDHSVRTRDGHTGPRTTGDIGFATLRGGSVVGEHTVIFAGAGERIELTHKAEDRSIFAQGAVAAALWARGRKPGLFNMVDVLGLSDTPAAT